MNSITIKHELCAEDRARLDRLTAALEKVAAAHAPTTLTANLAKEDGEQLAIDPELLDTEVRKKLEEIANSEEPENKPQEPVETEAPATTPAEEEKPAVVEEAPADEPKPAVTLAQIQQKVVQLCAGFNGTKKAAVREIVNAYAKKVSDLPEDKWTEVWDKLTALEEQ